MQMVKNSLILIVLLLLALVVFMPKKELYYQLEKQLEAQNIVISGETLNEGLVSLTVEHPVFYLGGAQIATAKQITLWSLLLYTKAEIEEMQIAEGLPTALSLQQAIATHSVIAPLQVKIEAESSLGGIAGEVLLQERSLHLELADMQENRAFTKYLKKGEKGWYYESQF